MSDIQNLSSKSVKPLTLLNKTNEIIDTVNEQLNTSYTETNPALTSVEGICTWIVTHNLGTEEVSCTVYEGDDEVFAKIEITSENVVTITINSSANITKDTYSVLILAKGGISDNGSSSITVDSVLSTISTNPVQNKVITEALNKLDGRKYDICSGYIASSSIDPAFKGIGGATITIYDCSDLVRIDYEYVVTSAGTMSGDWQYGLSADSLRDLSSYAVTPIITPITGGHLTIYNNSGYINNDLQGYCGTNIANGKYWPPARVFNAGSEASPNYVFGQWPQNMIGKGTRIAGVAYGTYTR